MFPITSLMAQNANHPLRLLSEVVSSSYHDSPLSMVKNVVRCPKKHLFIPPPCANIKRDCGNLIKIQDYENVGTEMSSFAFIYFRLSQQLIV